MEKAVYEKIVRTVYERRKSWQQLSLTLSIRHYGVYSRGIKRKFKRLLGVVSIAQTKLTHFSNFSGKWAPKCPNCGKKMEFALTWKCKPPPKWNFGGRISDWNYILPSGSRR